MQITIVDHEIGSKAFSSQIVDAASAIGDIAVDDNFASSKIFNQICDDTPVEH